MKEQKKQPELRFKGFTDDWEQRDLGDITEKIGSGKTPRGGSSSYSEKGVIFLRSQNIHSNKVDFSNIVYIDNHMDYEMANSRVQQGDVLLNITGASIGRSAVYNSNESANVNQHVCIIRPSDKISSEYIQLCLVSFDGQKKIEAYQAGGGREGLNFKQISEMTFIIPFENEQKQIGEFFQKLDHTITLQQRKLELLKKLKRGYLQQMFPVKDHIIPKLRFSGFSGNWKQRKLGEEAEILAGGDIDKNKLRKFGKYPVFANALTDDGIVGYYNDYFRIKAPAVTVTGRGAVGHAQARKINFTPVVRLLSVKSKHNVAFLENTINNHKVLVESTGVPQLTSPQLGNYKILFPTIEEEMKIGIFLSQLDNVINAYHSKIENTKSLKQAYLQKLFP
ncbi:restriction endonuclease subunit S [Latilactobacillus curvatus]|uniref:restriction endonuclease subunit S n=1 Tax=Latilactobacillus curvatus TaxID=28038 RepID=UPI0010AEC651|nr:restriction endonuclease subunit S [Latilactobacillus curvatus]TJY24516.1 restriction endonuclease subunit S [Latilactobacillus curvatus]